MLTSLLEAARSVYTVFFNGENEYKARLRAHTLSFMSFSLLIVLVLLLPSALLVERGEEGAMALRLMMLYMAGNVAFLLLDRRQLRDPRWALLWIVVSGSLLPLVFWYDAALGAIVLPMGLLVVRLVLGRALAWSVAILVCAAVLSAAWMRGLLPDNTKLLSLVANSILAMALMGVLMTIPARSSWQQRATKMFYAFAVIQTAKLIALTGLFALLEQPLWTLKDEPFYALLAGLCGWLAQRGYRQSVWLIGLMIACSFSYHLVDEMHKQGVFSSSALLLFVVIATLGLPAVQGRWFARIISLCVASIMIWQAEAETAAYFIVM
ncbi:MAG TPA: hypothetical protein VLA24_13010, partial [Pseudomonadales bacterium]|nr:hypothetical protein [Pseudomonadales bacterium]